MRKLQLTPILMLATIGLAAIPFVAFGADPMAMVYSVAAILGSALMVAPTPDGYMSSVKHPQAGEIGEDLKKISAEYQEVNGNLKKVSDEIKSMGEKTQAEIKRFGEISAETRAKVDELLTVQGELKGRLDAAEQLIVNLEKGGKGGGGGQQSVGDLVAQSEEYRAFDPGRARMFSVKIPSAAITSGSFPVEPDRIPGIVAPGQQTFFIRDLLAKGRTSSDAVQFVRETGFTNNASPVSELPLNGKPESNITFTMESASVATIAHYIRASRQVLDDASMLQSYINARLIYGLKVKEDLQLLKGSGAGLNINGIYTQASTYNLSVPVQNQNYLDELRLAILQAELAEYTVDGIVLNKIDWAIIELAKDKNGQYLSANPYGALANRLWGRPVSATQGLSQGEFLVGAFALGAQLYDREDANIAISLEDSDNFTKNAVTIRAEERLALTVYRPEAFVKGQFTSVISSN
jgi:HK97 family phage major capsid protein